MFSPRVFSLAAVGVERQALSSGQGARAGTDRSQRTVSPRRVRTDGAPRPLSATEQRWLREQLLRRRTSADVAARAATVTREASSMIERPTPAGAVVAHAGAEVGEAAITAPAPPGGAAARGGGRRHR